MKYLIPILTLCLCSGCASRKPAKPEPSPAISGTTLSQNDLAELRTPEAVKAYPVGRYSDPSFPDEMHERHTVYRREQSPDWNYRSDVPYTLPIGQAGTTSNPSPSYYVKAEGEMNAQQRAYAEVLHEQNRVMKKRIESLQQDAGKVPGLESEINRLKQQLDVSPQPPAEQSPAQPTEAKPEVDDIFSSVEPPLPVADEFTDASEIVLFADSDEQSQGFLISQMRLNDEFAAALEKAEKQKRQAAFNTPFLRRKELALLTK